MESSSSQVYSSEITASSSGIYAGDASTTHRVDAIQAFFETLYGQADDGFLVLSHPHKTKKRPDGKAVLASDWLDLTQASWDTIANAAKDQPYFGVLLQHPSGKQPGQSRSKNATGYAAPGLWFDIDFSTGDHKQAGPLPLNVEEVLAFLATLPPASLIVHTGGGVHAHWLFKELFMIRSVCDRAEFAHLADRFTATLADKAMADHGWNLDRLGDLARVLRAPGTINSKYNVHVELLQSSDVRYDPCDFDWLDDLPMPDTSPAYHSARPPLATNDMFTVQAVAEHYGATLEKKSLAELVGKHPQHDSSTGSNFNLNPTKGLWHCWRCNSGGDALSLIAVCEQLLPCEKAKKKGLSGALFKQVVAIANDTFQAGIVPQGRKAKAADMTQTGEQAEAFSPDPLLSGNGVPRPPRNPEALPLSDYTNALAFVRDHARDVRYLEAWEKWLHWTGTHWCYDVQSPIMQKAKATIKRLLRLAEDLEGDELDAWMKHIKSSLSAGKLKALVELAQDEPSVDIRLEALNTHPWLLPCQNGTIDLKTGQRQAARREDFLTECLSVHYEPKATCPTWEAFLWTIMGGLPPLAEDADALIGAELETYAAAQARAASFCGFLQRVLGQCLTGDVSEQDLYIFYGTGANGKSTLLNTILTLLEAYAMKGTAELLMTTRNDRHPTERADLFGKRLVATIETQEAGRLNETFIKEATGGDPIRARRMREDFWQFWPSHTMILATNHKPEIRGTDHAIWRRIKLVPFTVTIPDDEQDKTLPKKLLQELPGILTWMVQGCLDWQTNGLQPPPEVLLATEAYKQEQDIFEAFVATECFRTATARVSAADLYTAYEAWCKENEIEPIKQRAFGIRLGNSGFTADKGTGGRREWVGIGLPAREQGDARHGK